jgi:hypothetical protein
MASSGPSAGEKRAVSMKIEPLELKHRRAIKRLRAVHALQVRPLAHERMGRGRARMRFWPTIDTRVRAPSRSPPSHWK